MSGRAYKSHVSHDNAGSGLAPRLADSPRRCFALSPFRPFALTPTRLMLLVALTTTALLTGCDSPDSRADLVVLNGAEPESIDPAEITGQLDGRIAYALFEGLLHFDRFGHPQPGIAQFWDISPDRGR